MLFVWDESTASAACRQWARLCHELQALVTAEDGTTRPLVRADPAAASLWLLVDHGTPLKNGPGPSPQVN
jgi:hypothetical protein